MSKKSFDIDIAEFQKNFKSEFVDFFVTNTLEKNSIDNKMELEGFARKLYEVIFNFDKKPEGKKEFEEVLEYGLKLENGPALSLFYLLENFSRYVKEEQKDIKMIEILSHRAFQYIKSLDKKPCQLQKDEVVHVSFDTSENIIFGSNIIDKFKKIKEENGKVTFFNLYQGVPIKNEAKILDIDGEDVAFQTKRVQEIAMKLEGIAYILKDENFDKHIRANIVYNNFLNNSMTLNNFTYMLNMPASQREFVRVHPNITAFVTLQDSRDDHATGKLYDLSTDGLGVVGEDKKNLYIGAKIQVSFSINEEDIQTDGELVNIIEYADSYRFCIKINPHGRKKESIKNYVALRQEEILQELKKHLEEYGL